MKKILNLAELRIIIKKTERWVVYVIGNIVCIVIICNTDRGSDKEIYQMGYIAGGI